MFEQVSFGPKVWSWNFFHEIFFEISFFLSVDFFIFVFFPFYLPPFWMASQIISSHTKYIITLAISFGTLYWSLKIHSFALFGPQCFDFILSSFWLLLSGPRGVAFYFTFTFHELSFFSIFITIHFLSIYYVIFYFFEIYLSCIFWGKWDHLLPRPSDEHNIKT